MGITFLAAGGNVPELASIVILARQGKRAPAIIYTEIEIVERALCRYICNI